MGSSHSVSDDHPTMFKAKNIDDKDKTKNCVYLEVKSNNLFVHSKYKKMMASWPIQSLQRYGFNDEMLLIETGHGCDTGQALFLFKCPRATEIFERIKDAWAEIHNQSVLAYPNLSYLPQMSVMTGTTVVPSTSYYNTSGSGRDGVPLTAGFSSGHPSTSNSRYTPPTPGTRGSASSQNTGISGSQRSLPRTFALQPAPAGRQEMLDRRRINSNAVSFHRQNESIVFNHTRHHTVAADCDYENRDIIQRHENSEHLRVTESVAFKSNTQNVTLHQELLETPHRGVSANSLRSDGDHVPLTPVSNSTSGIGSLNGNSTASEGKQNGGVAIPPSVNLGNPQLQPPPIPPVDPWRKQNIWAKNRRSQNRRIRQISEFSRLSPGLPMSARDYVNTVNASLDVSGTPLPATAAVASGNHFSFDFDPRLSVFNNANLFGHNHDLNYVPIEVSTKNGDFYSCGASSSSSGLPGTPLTPGGQNFACDYAEIDHNKTRALSNAFRSRQREIKSRHTSSEAPGLLNGNV